MAEGVVDGAEAVEVDEDQRGAFCGAFGLVQGGPGALQQPQPVRQSGQRVAQLLLGAGARDAQRGVECDQRDGEQRQERRLVHRDDDDERRDAQQRDGDQTLPHHGGAQRRGQSAGARGEAEPLQSPGGQQIPGGGQRDHGPGGRRPVVGLPRVLDRGVHPAQCEGQSRGGDAEDVDGPVHERLPPAVPPRPADQHHDREADQQCGHPAVQQQHGEGQRRARTGAAPPAVPAHGDQMRHHTAGEDRERPSRGCRPGRACRPATAPGRRPRPARAPRRPPPARAAAEGAAPRGAGATALPRRRPRRSPVRCPHRRGPSPSGSPSHPRTCPPRCLVPPCPGCRPRAGGRTGAWIPRRNPASWSLSQPSTPAPRHDRRLCQQ